MPAAGVDAAVVAAVTGKNSDRLRKEGLRVARSILSSFFCRRLCFSIDDAQPSTTFRQFHRHRANLPDRIRPRQLPCALAHRL